MHFKHPFFTKKKYGMSLKFDPPPYENFIIFFNPSLKFSFLKMLHFMMTLLQFVLSQ